MDASSVTYSCRYSCTDDDDCDPSSWEIELLAKVGDYVVASIAPENSIAFFEEECLYGHCGNGECNITRPADSVVFTAARHGDGEGGLLSVSLPFNETFDCAVKQAAEFVALMTAGDVSAAKRLIAL